MAAEVEQALYGYHNGHRLIASSMPLPAEAGRTLRSLTDMAFDGRAKSYLTSFPLPALRRHALVRTWPAPDAARAGSVWSHVLLVDFVDLGALEHLAALEQLFRRPDVGSDGKPNPGPYEEPVPLPANTPARRRASTKQPHRLRILWAAYGDSGSSLVRVDDPAQIESLLFEIWTQQWPRLRRSFGFRTRYRVGDKRSNFSVQIVERLQRDQEQAEFVSEPPSWLLRLDDEIRHPDQVFRQFLQRFGAESKNGNEDFARLVEVHTLLEREPDPVRAVELVAPAFPAAQSMAALKYALFGPAESPDALGRGDEARRLMAILHAQPAAALDLKQLQFGPRVEALWHRNSTSAVDLLCHVAASEPPNRRAARIVIRPAVEHVKPQDIRVIAASDPALAVGLVAQRQDLITAPTVWRSGDEVVARLLELLAEADSETRRGVLLALLRSNATEAQEVIRQDPTAWWDALAWAADSISEGRSLDRTAGALGRLLEAAGPASIGSGPTDLPDEALVLLALAAPPQVGLWRQITAAQWRQVSGELTAIENEKLLGRALVVLIAATRQPGKAATRRKLWRAAFPGLHALLEADAVGGGELKLLNDVLPNSGDDPAARLRQGLVKEIKRGDWPADEVKSVLSSVPEHAPKMLAALRSKGKKKKKSLWREFYDFLSF